MDFVGLEKLTLVDFDHHMSCILFAKGCNFACPFCHNSALVLAPELNNPIPFDDVLAFLRKRTGLLDAVVISGGEPTLMPDLKEKLKAIKDLGYLIKLDTNGTRPEVIKDLVASKLVDYIAMDVKSSLDTYPLITNALVNKNKIKESINFIKTCGIDYEFRTTLVKEFHTENDISKMGNLLQGAKRLRLQLFIDNPNCILPGLHEVDVITANRFVEILKNHVTDVALRGYNI